jgi:hypothetical protein
MSPKFPVQNAYGTLPIHPMALLEELDNAWREGDQINIPATQELFRFLERLGEKARGHPKGKVVEDDGLHDWKEVKSFFGGKERQCREFLIDFLWSQKGFGTLLACESEMCANLIGMQHDFEKILCWKAPMKLMIVQERRDATPQQIADGLAGYANDNIHQFVKDECCLLFVFGAEGNHAYGHVSSGAVAEAFEFIEVPLPVRQSSTAYP